MTLNTIEEAIAKERAWLEERVWLDKRIGSVPQIFFTDELIRVSASLPDQAHVSPVELWFNDPDYRDRETPTRGIILYEGDLSFHHKPYPAAESVELGHVTVGYDQGGKLLVKTRLWVGDSGGHNTYSWKRPEDGTDEVVMGAERFTDELAKRVGGTTEFYNHFFSLPNQQRPVRSPFTSGLVFKVNRFDSKNLPAVVEQIIKDMGTYFALAKEIVRTG